VVTLDGGSTQRIEFLLHHDRNVLRATSTIASRSVVTAAATESGDRYAWERNRLSDLVGFSIGHHGRLVGSVWIPLDGLTTDEFRLYVAELARVCDWHEFRLTGTDAF
jgi:hypothetical protein